MGMFDYLRIDKAMLPVQLPDGMREDWQTKDTPEQYLRTYQITADRELHLLKWDKEKEGYFFECALDDYHGDLRFYTSHPTTHEWFEFNARFTDGKLSRIWRVGEDDESFT